MEERTAAAAASMERLRARLKRPVARTPYVFDVVAHTRRHDRERLARRTSALVIEGFPRSANTFAVVAFLEANGQHLHLGHHLHAAAHLLRAARLQLPAIALVRDPRAAAASYLIRRRRLTGKDALREYVEFYETAWRVRDAFVVAEFDEVIVAFGAVISRVNARFGTSFIPYEHSEENDARCFAEVERRNRREGAGEVVETHVARPSAQRSAARHAVEAKLDAPSAQRLLTRAQDIHRRYQSLAATQRRSQTAQR